MLTTVSPHDLEVKFPIECSILRSLGKLTGEFKNVYDHSLMVACFVFVVSRLLGIRNWREVVIAAILHDAEKHMQVSRRRGLGHFTKAEEQVIEEAIRGRVSQALRNATKPHSREVLGGMKTFFEFLLFLADISTFEVWIVGPEKRGELTTQSGRWKELDWQLGVQFARFVMVLIWHRLYKKGIDAGDPTQLFEWVNAHIESDAGPAPN